MSHLPATTVSPSCCHLWLFIIIIYSAQVVALGGLFCLIILHSIFIHQWDFLSLFPLFCTIRCFPLSSVIIDKCTSYIHIGFIFSFSLQVAYNILSHDTAPDSIAFTMLGSIICWVSCILNSCATEQGHHTIARYMYFLYGQIQLLNFTAYCNQSATCIWLS